MMLRCAIIVCCCSVPVRALATTTAAAKAAQILANSKAATQKIQSSKKSARDDDDGEWPLLRELRRACKDFELIQPGDKIAVAVSGGKDSSTLAYLLGQLKTRRLLPFDDWSFTTIHLDQVQPNHDPSSLQAWIEAQGIEWNLAREDTYSIVTEKTKPGASYCSLCSRLRRGILYTAANDLGCNRLALGHHRDDALETLLLNSARARMRASNPSHSSCPHISSTAHGPS